MQYQCILISILPTIELLRISCFTMNSELRLPKHNTSMLLHSYTPSKSLWKINYFVSATLLYRYEYPPCMLLGNLIFCNFGTRDHSQVSWAELTLYQQYIDDGLAIWTPHHPHVVDNVRFQQFQDSINNFGRDHTFFHDNKCHKPFNGNSASVKRELYSWIWSLASIWLVQFILLYMKKAQSQPIPSAALLPRPRSIKRNDVWYCL